MGFIPGYLTSYGVYYLLEKIVKIPLKMSIAVTLRVFILTFLMCAISGVIASRKLRSADPADIFN